LFTNCSGNICHDNIVFKLCHSCNAFVA
jgi:hypothetical protein